MRAMTKPKAQPPRHHVLFVRNFPKDLTREIKSRAALADLTVAAYLASVLSKAMGVKTSA